MQQFQRESILRDEDLAVEIARQLPNIEPVLEQPPEVREILRPATKGEASRAAHAEATVRIEEALGLGPRTEAIIQRLGRPTLLVRNDTFEVPPTETWRARLYPTKTKVDAAIRSVGRIEVAGQSMPFIGTAWLISPNIAVTNRHVALGFSTSRGSEFAFRINPIGQPYQPRVDFKEEYVQTTPFEVRVAKVLYIADEDDAAPDLAFLQLDDTGGRQLPPPIPLFDGDAAHGQTVVVIGYPAEDPRNNASDQARLFGGVYDVKRVAPGEVMGSVNDAMFTHDCTTLGGSSGSVVLDVTTGSALGLHFAGEYLDANYAVSAKSLTRYLGKIQAAPVVIDSATLAAPEPEGRVDLAALAGREGFSTTFLGTDKLEVRLPVLPDGLASLTVTVDAAETGTERFMLPYTHFSVATHSDRRMALFTAVNIDGDQSRKIKRTADKWSFDPRIADEHQIGNELYAGNDLDRGHLVRRLDPAWGDTDEAKSAEVDTFFYTNCSPQHSEFNQHMWLGLEDYLLSHADTLDFKASVFTGPVFDDEDPVYRDVKMPKAYWKVAAMVHTDGDRLSATGYIVSQSDLLTDVEFVFGKFKTYQVPIARIEELTGLSFGELRDGDPLGTQEAVSVVELRSPEDIRL